MPGDFRNIVDTLPVGVFTIDTNWRIATFNHTAETLTGYKRCEVIDHHCWEIFRSEKCRRKCPLEVALTTGETRVDQEVRTFNRSGLCQTLLVNVSVLRNSGRGIVGALETFRVVREGEEGTDAANAWDTHPTGMIARSRAMLFILERLPDVAISKANVLISGESGTGKELLARAIHRLSPRHNQPFVAVNCAALAESLLESELFGHEKGAFTNADRAKPGRFEMASGGTLFLDEIGDMKPELQVKLLRVIEQREFERVGGTRSIPLDARIISATNQDLDLALAEGRFRQDLYYRLRTVPLSLPPLRERQEDIPLLIDHFIKVFNKRYAKNVRSVDPKVVTTLSRYSWPGNIRELERCLEHAFVFVKGPVIFAHYLPDLNGCLSPSHVAPGAELEPFFGRPDLNRMSLIRALEKCSGKRREAADLLGISRTSMWRQMKRHGLL